MQSLAIFHLLDMTMYDRLVHIALCGRARYILYLRLRLQIKFWHQERRDNHVHRCKVAGVEACKHSPHLNLSIVAHRP